MSSHPIDCASVLEITIFNDYFQDMVVNSTLNNHSSVISWRSILPAEETG
jgi:hypothetical protein